MFKLFKKKNQLSLLLALFLLCAMKFSLEAQDCCYAPESCPCPPTCNNRIYVGAFGGELFSNKTRIVQTGTAFFPEIMGGPLAVDAHGRSRRHSPGFGGLQIGFEWTQSPFYFGCSDWNLTTAVELEALFYRHKRRGDLINPTTRLPEHDFFVSLPMNVEVFLINGLLTLNNGYCGKFFPYIGGGVGAVHLSIRKACSLQVDPPEFGINHFNSRRHDSAWTFGAQGKAGLRYNVWDRFHIFGEYRFLYIDSSRFSFGATNYPTHAPTSTWQLDVKNTWYNAFAIGIQFDLQ